MDVLSGAWFRVQGCWPEIHLIMGQVILTNTSVLGGIVNHHVYWLQDSLAKPCSSLSTILKLSIMVMWPWCCVATYGWGCFRCSFYLSSNGLADSIMYFSSWSTLPHLYLYIIPLWHCFVSLFLWQYKNFLYYSAVPEICVVAIFTAYTFDVFT